MVIDESDTPANRTRPSPGPCRPSGPGRRLEGPLFRRGALSRLPGTVFRCNPAARHRARHVPRTRRARTRHASFSHQRRRILGRRLRAQLPPAPTRWAGLGANNLAAALWKEGEKREGVDQVEKAGRRRAGDPAGLAIRDKSNLVLGSMLFESGNFERARKSLDRVHLEGPFSNEALLRAGWAEASAQQYDRALVPWNILVDRHPTNAAVQKVMLPLPHAYAGMIRYVRARLG